MPTETRKLVKAMFRAEEYLPEGVPCCPSLRKRYEKHKGIEFTADMSTLRAGECGCRFCGAQFGAVTFVTLIDRKEYESDVWIQTLDLDEVPAEIQAERNGRYVDADLDEGAYAL